MSIPQPIPVSEHDKLKIISHLSQAQGEFFEWLRERGYVLATYRDGDILQPAIVQVSTLLAEFHGIDLHELEREKRQMLDELIAASKQP